MEGNLLYQSFSKFKSTNKKLYLDYIHLKIQFSENIEVKLMWLFTNSQFICNKNKIITSFLLEMI